MAAYMVFTREKMLNQAEFDKYGPMAGASMKGHEATPLAVYGKHETLEGAPIEGAVVLSFPTYEAALAWYNSPAYTTAREQRFKGADYRAFIVQGM
jgi:uncharacterized protein (DUF1330 family)